ncbi:hypothetical protein [Alloalcanivorax xenomutans]
MNVIIVASGPSARGFRPPDGLTVIAVNGAIDWISRADYWFTLDPSPDNVHRMTERRPGVHYCAAVPPETELPSGVVRFERVASDGPVPRDPRTPEDWLCRWGAVPGLSINPNTIHTGNSAYGALGLAYHLGAHKVALVGVDATGEDRVEGGTPGNLSHLPLLFASALDQMDIVSCGRLTGVPQMSVAEGMAWLMI